MSAVKLPILSEKDCIAAFENYNTSYLGAYDFDPETQLCAGLNEIYDSFCNNDIGSYLFFFFVSYLKILIKKFHFEN